jgi:hypothetical protein
MLCAALLAAATFFAGWRAKKIPDTGGECPGAE